LSNKKIHRINEIFHKDGSARRIWIWRIIGGAEFLLMFMYKIVVPFIPALVFAELGYQLHASLLAFAGILKLLYNVFNKSTLKEIWMYLMWIKDHKK